MTVNVCWKQAPHNDAHERYCAQEAWVAHLPRNHTAVIMVDTETKRPYFRLYDSVDHNERLITESDAYTTVGEAKDAAEAEIANYYTPGRGNQGFSGPSEILTGYTDLQNKEHAALLLKWNEVTEILGHSHDGDPDDDQALIAHLSTLALPEWFTGEEEGWVDEIGWGLIGPCLDLLDMLDELHRHDLGAYGVDATDVAREWVDQGFAPEDAASWLNTGVCYATHALQLARTGFTGDTLPPASGWRTDEDVWDLIEDRTSL